MPDTLCIECGIRPRRVSKSGKMLTKCTQCQQAEWRNRKRKEFGYQPRTKKKTVTVQTKPNIPDRDQPTSRKCITCKVTKPISQFRRWGMNYRRTCKQCEDHISNDSPSPATDAEHIVLVNGSHVVLAQIVSEKPDTRRPSLVADFYRQKGYTITHVFESKANS